MKTIETLMKDLALLTRFFNYTLAPCNNGKAFDNAVNDVLKIHGTIENNAYLKIHSSLQSWDYLIPIIQQVQERVGAMADNSDTNVIGELTCAYLDFDKELTQEKIFDAVGWYFNLKEQSA